MPWLFVFLVCLTPANMCLAATADDGRWHAGIGDPTIWGWVTVAVYFFATYRCLLKARIADRTGGRSINWLCLAIFLLLLGLNKQLDLQTFLTEVFRDLSRAHGWYEQRRKVQLVFIVAIGFAMTIALISLRMFLYEAWRKHKLVWYGMFLLCTFIISRAASFHHVDILINTKIFGVKMNFILENSALLLVILGSYSQQKVEMQPERVYTQKASTHVEVGHEGDAVICPQCMEESKSRAAHGRKFKCKQCQHVYRVSIKNF
ncbi:MAG: hypothetical protein SFU55_06995 [Methylophilus sp.]|nr:hypothetical protein [Methylophilus sp.]